MMKKGCEEQLLLAGLCMASKRRLTAFATDGCDSMD
jgi:hypothetical protein